MSNCLVLQGKNFIAIGADTASSILIDEKYKRVGVDAKKLYQFGNEIMFCSGKMELVELVTSNVVAKDNKIDLDDLTEFIKSLNIEKSDTYDLEILICGVENNKSYMHQISQYNDFEVKTITNNTNGCAIYSTGFNAKTMLDTAKKNYPLCQNVSDLFIKSFKDISSEEVGGYINMYLLQENQTTKCVDNYKVDDIKPISVSRNDIHYVVADVLIGDMIIGETLLVANSSGTFLVDKDGIIVKNMKLDMSNADGTRRIVIDPELDSILSIYTNSKQVFYVDTNGNMCMLGNLYVNNNNMYLKVDMTSKNIIEVGYGKITGTGNEGEAGSGEGGVNTGNYVKQMWEQVDYGQDIYNGTVPIIKAGLDSNIAIFNGATVFKQQCFLNYGGEIYHLVHGGYLIKYNEKQKSWNLVTKIENQYVTDAYHSSLVKTDKEDGNIYIYYMGGYPKWGVLLKYNLETGVLNEVWTNGVSTSGVSNYNYGRHYIKGDTFYVANYAGNVYPYTPSKVTLNSDRSYSVGGYSQWAPENTVIHEIIPYNGNEYAVISIGQSKVMLIKFKNIDAFTYDVLYTFDYTMSSNLRTGGIIADAFNDKIVVVFKHMSIHYEYDIKTDTMNIADEFKISLLYNSAESPNCGDSIQGVSGFSMIASKDKLHMFAIGANQCYGGDIITSSYTYQYIWKDLSFIPQYYIRHYEYLDDGKLEMSKNFEKLTSGYNFYMSRQCSFTKIGDTIYNIPTFWQMLSGSTGMNSKTANYTSWNVPIYALDTTSKDNDFQIICNNIGVQIICLINSNSTSKIYFFAGTDATYLQYYDLETQTVGSVFTDENGSRVASNLSWCLFSYLDENEQILYEMGTSFARLDLTTNTMLESTSLGITVHSNVEIINNEFYFVSLTSDGSKAKLYKITKSGVLSAVTTMQEADDIGSNMGHSIAYYNNKIHMYYATNGVLKRKRYEYSFDTGEVTSYTDMFQDNGMYTYDDFWGISPTCHLPAIATSTGIHYFTGTTYDFNNKFTNPFNHYVYTEDEDTGTNEDDEIVLSDSYAVLTDGTSFHSLITDMFRTVNGLESWRSPTFSDITRITTVPDTYLASVIVSDDSSPVEIIAYLIDDIVAIYTTAEQLVFNEDCSHMFYDIYNPDAKLSILKSNIYTLNVTNMSHMFSSFCGDIDLGDNFDTSNVTDMSFMFYMAGQYSSKTSASIFNLGKRFNTSNVTNMSNMFANLYYWVIGFDIDLGYLFDTNSVESCTGIFESAFGGNTDGQKSSIDLGFLFNISPTDYSDSYFVTDGAIFYGNSNMANLYPEYIIEKTYDESLYGGDDTAPTIPDVENPTDKIFYITNTGDGYFYGNVYAKDGIFKGDIIAKSLTLGDGVSLSTSDISGMDDYVMTDVGLGTESGTYCKISKDGLLTAKNAIITGQANINLGYIGGWVIGDSTITGTDSTNNTGITLNSNGDITSYGANQWMWLNGGNLYFGVGKQVDFSKAHSFISSNGIYVASNAAINSTDGITNYLLVADTNTDQVMISTHTDAKSALCIYNDSNTDTSNLDGEASGITIKTDYAGFSNRPLDIIAKTGNDDGSQNYIYMNVFGQYEGSGDGSSFDEYGRLTLRSAINTGTEWIGNDTSLSNGYIPSSIGSTTFRWGQGFFHDLTTTNSVKEASDRKLKEHIEYLDSKESLEFINHLQPAEYTMICSENKRVHRGFYAQEVSKTAHELDCRDLSLYSAYVEKDGNISPYDENEDDENLRWSLSYNEFIAPMVSAIQELSKENKELKDRIEKLEGENSNG